ncbi:MAG: hypothetical protein PHT19_10380 [Methylococcus sp.]|nr:hypothetical protein [Methylococcus sp.]
MTLKTRLRRLEQRREKARPLTPLIVFPPELHDLYPPPTPAEIAASPRPVIYVVFEGVEEPAHVH